MEVKILQKFHDREDFTKVYPVGETVIFDDVRAKYLIGLGLVEEIVETPAEEIVEEAIEAEAAEIIESVETPADETSSVESSADETPAEEIPVKPVATSRRNSKNN